MQFNLQVLILLYCGLCSFYYGVESANILGVFQYPSKSHYILGTRLLKELVRQGHNVTMISPFRGKDLMDNYTEIEITGILDENIKAKNDLVSLTDSTIGKIWTTIKIFDMKLDYVNIIRHPVFENLLRDNSTSFDLIIQFWAMCEAFVGLGEHFQAPVIGFSALGGNFHINHLLNTPNNPSYIPNHLLPFSHKMSLWQKTANFLVNTFIDLYLKFVAMPYQNKVYTELFPKSRPFEQALDSVDLFFINSHVCTESPRPYLPNMIQIGGFHIDDSRKLPPDLQDYLDNSPEGVIYFSLGSNLRSSSLSLSLRRTLIKTFKNLNMKVLWKFEGSLGNFPKNIKISPWMPQAEILAHKNVKLFVTHGGLGSVAEAIYFGVPFVGIPFFLDQENNVAESTAKGIALEVKFQELTEEKLSKAIREILSNPKYRERMRIFSSLFRDQPMKPIDTAVFWVEHVLKHKRAKHLKTYASAMPFYEYYILDVLVSICIGVLLVFVVFKWTVGNLLGFALKVKPKKLRILE